MGKTDTHVFRHGPASHASLMSGWSQMAMGLRSTVWETASTFLLPRCTVSVTEEESTPNTASLLYRKRDVGPFSKSSPNIRVHAPSFHPFQVRPAAPQCWGDESRAPKRQTASASRWRVPGKLINHWTQNGTSCPLSSLSRSPVPLFWDIPFYLGWWRVRVREIRSSNRAMVVLYYSYLFTCWFPSLDSKLPGMGTSPSFHTWHRAPCPA